MSRSFVPVEYEVPDGLDTARFVLRMLSVDIAERDYDAVMTSVEHIRGVFGPLDRWPSPDMTLDQNRADLARHQADFLARRSFAYTVLTPDHNKCLGCVYISPSPNRAYDAAAFMWVRASEKATGLDALLFSSVQRWLQECWPFRKVAFPGRDIPWAKWFG